MSKINERSLNKAFENKAKQVFDQKADTLDSQTQQRLRVAREAALSQKSRKLSLSSIKWLTGAGAGLALASLLSFLIIPGLISGKQQTNTLAMLEDIEMLSTEADLELYSQLEFYQWLDESLNEHPNKAKL